MDTIDTHTVQKLAQLSRLQFTQSEAEELTEDLGQIVDWMAKLAEVDTEGVAPLYHLTENTNELREDSAHNPLSKQEALSNAPKTDGDFFLVPKVK